MIFDNDKKIVLITGSTGDIGKSISIEFAKNNWNVLCHYNSDNEEKIFLENYFEANQFNYFFIKSDFSKEDNLNNFIKQISFFKIDSVINNAGTYINNFIDEEENLSKIIDLFMINVFAPMKIIAKVFPKMKENRFGRIVNISSIAAEYGSPFCAMPYGCSKRSLEGITKSVYKEGALYNVLINTIRPGFIDTKFHKKFPKNISERISKIPVKKPGKTKDISDMVYYLGSDNNQFITNDIITISGGE